MRISGGTAKGRKTATKRLLMGRPSNGRLRPTSSKVREALFDILRDRVGNASFVDLFAGTGTVGFEALSRGAREAVFVEPDQNRFREIGRAAIDLGLRERCRIFRKRARDFLKKAAAEGQTFDIFFLDPPYQSGDMEEVLLLLGEGRLMDEKGVVVAEHSSRKTMPLSTRDLKMEKNYRYGDTMLTLYRKMRG